MGKSNTTGLFIWLLDETAAAMLHAEIISVEFEKGFRENPAMASSRSETEGGGAVPDQYRAAVRLEQLLGDPGAPENLLSFRQGMLWDEDDQFPEPAMTRLHRLGLHHVYVPKSLGGQFEHCESFLALGRTIARRNMSVAVSYSTMLWTMLAWMGGAPDPQRRIARAILQDGAFFCLAYSEERHGADLISNETTARVDELGLYRACGEKWPINRATRSQWVVLLARTNAEAHLRNHSLFMVEKAQLDPQSFYHLPRLKTHGLRGCDISGVGFRDCLLPRDACIGPEGAGIELALKGFQITRTFCTALSLGVGDSALRIVAEFARGRLLYNQRVADLPHARDTLANAYLSLLMGECEAVVAARGLHLFPGQFSTWSSIAKVQVVRLADHAAHQVGAILGARAYLRERQAEGMFQKFLRDGAIVAVFDGSSIVCLDRLATVLPQLCRPRDEKLDEQSLATLFDLRQPVPPLPFDEFTILGRGRDAVMQSLPQLALKLRSLPPDRHCSAGTLEMLNEQTRQLENAIADLRAAVNREPTARSTRNSAVRLGYAERYCALHVAISCLGFWLYNRGQLSDFADHGEWLVAALARQGEVFHHCGSLPTALTDALCDRLFEQTDQFHMYSLVPWPLASAGQREDNSDQRLWKKYP